MSDNREAYLLLKKYRHLLTKQQVSTLAGQIRHGKHNEAMNGLAKILDRVEREKRKASGFPETIL